jgi:H+/Cl- antiporter ClcA
MLSLKHLSHFFKRASAYLRFFVLWLCIGTGIGFAGGIIGYLFHYSVDAVTAFREKTPLLIWLLPSGGAVIALLYKFSGVSLDTNRILRVIHTREPVPWLMGPLIFVSTVITHLFGGSAGREGAALQLGGTLGYQVGTLLKLDDRDIRLIVMSGMSAVFSALFGSPVTAAIFSMEVSSIGIIHYSGLIPCLTSAFVAAQLASALHVPPFAFDLGVFPSFSLQSAGLVLLLAALCALLSIVFCVALHRGEKLTARLFPNNFVRIMVGGALLAILTWLYGATTYNGAGTQVIAQAIAGQSPPEAFFMKLAFTVLTISVGFKGGEIIPTMFVGATFGCLFGQIVDFNPGFCAAIGMVALFCGMVNCPISSIFLGLEVFGGQGLYFFVIACGVSYVLSGSYGLYHEQNLVYSKLKTQYINIHTK